jgi:uncharacterized protein (DUF2236 family)
VVNAGALAVIFAEPRLKKVRIEAAVPFARPKIARRPAQKGPYRLPRRLQDLADAMARAQLQAPGVPAVDFTHPPGECALAPPDSVSWQVFRNPVALLVGGIAAVILELAEPRVRAGVWNHTNFRDDPLTRLRRTGLAAMVTVYGARSTAERMIAGVRSMHERVRGETPAGVPYQASDPELLRWVQATAAFGFLEAYRTYVRPLAAADRDRFYAEGTPAAHLYGADGVPGSEAGILALFEATYGRLERSDTVFEFLGIMRRAALLPRVLRPVQGLLVRAAVEIVPDPVRSRLGLGAGEGLRPWERVLVKAAGRTADRLMLRSSPAVQACVRLGLPQDYLFGRA